MKILSDEEIKEKFNAVGTKDGVTLFLRELTMTRYEAFRFSRFLDDAIHESCRLSREKIDGEFEHGR